MPDSFLLITPLLVLAVVLLLGFAGCGFNVYVPGEPTLTFRARVPIGLTALGGVSFRWIRPAGTIEEVETVTSFAPDGKDNVYEHQITSPEDGMWRVSCEMVAEDGGSPEPKISLQCEFVLPATSDTPVYVFQAEGIPLFSFEIKCKGLQAG